MDPTGQAESLAELNSRVRAAFDQVETQSPDGDVLVVAHGVVLSALIRLIDPTDLPLTLLKIRVLAGLTSMGTIGVSSGLT